MSGTDIKGAEPPTAEAAPAAEEKTVQEGAASEEKAMQKAALDETTKEQSTGGAGDEAGTPVSTSPPDPRDVPGEPAHVRDPNYVRIKKRKIALFVSYLGHEFFGMQRNPGVRTVEQDLFDAVCAAGGISERNADDEGFQKLHWTRVARTDRGVSAIGQVVSLNMMLEPEGVIDRINAALPSDISVWGYQRATGGFDARKHCDARRYEYVLPAWAFDRDLDLGLADAAQVSPGAGAVGGAGADAAASSGAGEGEVAPTSASASVDKPALARTSADDPPAFIFTEAMAAEFGAILGQYAGSHNFHNFTPKGDPTTPYTRRFIKSFLVEGVFYPSPSPGERVGAAEGGAGGEREGRGADGGSSSGLAPAQQQQWVRLSVTGQSFMLNQIRIMIGLALAVWRGVVPPDSIGIAMETHRKLNPPMAPALGLYLDGVYYEGYNDRFGDLHGRLSFEPYQDAMAAFRAERLHPSLARIDGSESINLDWLRQLHSDKFGRWDDEAWRLTEREVERVELRVKKKLERAKIDATKGDAESDGKGFGGRGFLRSDGAGLDDGGRTAEERAASNARAAGVFRPASDGDGPAASADTGGAGVDGRGRGRGRGSDRGGRGGGRGRGRGRPDGGAKRGPGASAGGFAKKGRGDRGEDHGGAGSASAPPEEMSD